MVVNILFSVHVQLIAHVIVHLIVHLVVHMIVHVMFLSHPYKDADRFGLPIDRYCIPQGHGWLSLQSKMATLPHTRAHDERSHVRRGRAGAGERGLGIEIEA